MGGAPWPIGVLTTAAHFFSWLGRCPDNDISVRGPAARAVRRKTARSAPGQMIAERRGTESKPSRKRPPTALPDWRSCEWNPEENGGTIPLQTFDSSRVDPSPVAAPSRIVGSRRRAGVRHRILVVRSPPQAIVLTSETLGRQPSSNSRETAKGTAIQQRVAPWYAVPRRSSLRDAARQGIARTACGP